MYVRGTMFYAKMEDKQWSGFEGAVLSSHSRNFFPVPIWERLIIVRRWLDGTQRHAQWVACVYVFCMNGWESARRQAIRMEWPCRCTLLFPLLHPFLSSSLSTLCSPIICLYYIAVDASFQEASKHLSICSASPLCDASSNIVHFVQLAAWKRPVCCWFWWDISLAALRFVCICTLVCVCLSDMKILSFSSCAITLGFD